MLLQSRINKLKKILKDMKTNVHVNRGNHLYVRRYRYDPRRFDRSQPRIHKGGSLGVWSCLTNYGLGDLVFYNSRLDSSGYINILGTHLKLAYNLFPKLYRDQKNISTR
ncbi:unnamed protein product [Rotaria sordida]|uniref:Uncharacterized protein n=1 Tax=Rotaria sordida TaxID=392033 RepID=A0A813TM55_9BILA|nr:unnamed protein product [Rotaria sordida]